MHVRKPPVNMHVQKPPVNMHVQKPPVNMHVQKSPVNMHVQCTLYIVQLSINILQLELLCIKIAINIILYF